MYRNNGHPHHGPSPGGEDALQQIGPFGENTPSELYVPMVSVILPALNEADNLPYVLPRIPSWVHEIILVDGNSTDETVEVACRLYPDIRIVMQEGTGKGAAIRSGIQAATGDIVVLLDADGSTDPQEIPVFVATLLAGADFAKGSRFLQGGGTVDMPLYRRLGNGMFVQLTNLLFGTRFTDITYGYNAVWRRHAPALALEIDGWANEIISNIRAANEGLKVVEVASFEYRRIEGEAKLSTVSAGLTILIAIVREVFSKGAANGGAGATNGQPTKEVHKLTELVHTRLPRMALIKPMSTIREAE